MYNSVLFNTCTVLSNHYHSLVPERFYHPKRKPCTRKTALIFPPSQPLAITDVLSVPKHLPILDISYEIIQYVAFWIYLLSLNTMFLKFIYVVAWITTSFLLWPFFHYMNIVYIFIHSSIDIHSADDDGSFSMWFLPFGYC